MNYLKEIWKYYFKSFAWLAFFVCIPVLFIGLILHPFKMIEFLAFYPGREFNSFGDFWNMVFDAGALPILCLIAGTVVLVVGICLLFGAVEKHFKTGKVSLKNDFSLNSNLPSVALIMIITLGICLLVNFVSLLLIYVVHFIFANNGVAIWVNIAFSYIVVLCAFMFLIRVFSVASLTCVEMLLNGSPFKNSFSDALSSLDRAGWSLRFFEILVFTIIVGLVLASAYLGLTWLGEMLSMFVLVPIECVMGMIVFFELNGLPRCDKKQLF